MENIYLCGQLEPSQKVIKPVKKLNLSKEQEDFIMLHIVRHFEKARDGGLKGGVRFDSIQQLFHVSKFKPAYSDANLKRIMRQFLDEVDGYWYLKNFYKGNRIPVQEADEKTKRLNTTIATDLIKS